MIQISPLTDEDIPSAADILFYSWQLHTSQNGLYDSNSLTKPKAVSWLTKVLHAGNRFAFVAKEKSTTIGFISLEIQDNPSYYTHPRQLFVIDVVVAKEHHKKGVATLLEQRAEDLAKELGVHQISGNVDSWNSASQALMKKLGRTKGYEEWHKFI